MTLVVRYAAYAIAVAALIFVGYNSYHTLAADPAAHSQRNQQIAQLQTQIAQLQKPASAVIVHGPGPSYTPYSCPLVGAVYTCPAIP